MNFRQSAMSVSREAAGAVLLTESGCPHRLQWAASGEFWLAQRGQVMRQVRSGRCRRRRRRRRLRRGWLLSLDAAVPVRTFIGTVGWHRGLEAQFVIAGRFVDGRAHSHDVAPFGQPRADPAFTVLELLQVQGHRIAPRPVWPELDGADELKLLRHQNPARVPLPLALSSRALLGDILRADFVTWIDHLEQGAAELAELGGLFLGDRHDRLLAGDLKLLDRLHDEPSRFKHAPRLERVQRLDQERADPLDFAWEALVTKAIHSGLILTDHHQLGFDGFGAGLDLLAVHVRDGPHQLFHRADEGTRIHTVTKHQNLRSCQQLSARVLQEKTNWSGT